MCGNFVQFKLPLRPERPICLSKEVYCAKLPCYGHSTAVQPPLIIHHSSYTTHHTPLIKPPLIIHHSSYTTHHTPLIKPPLIIHHSSYTTHQTTTHQTTTHHTPLIKPPLCEALCEPPCADFVAGAIQKAFSRDSGRAKCRIFQ